MSGDSIDRVKAGPRCSIQIQARPRSPRSKAAANQSIGAMRFRGHRQSSGEPAPSPQLARSKRAREGDMGQPVPPTAPVRRRRSITAHPKRAHVDPPRPVTCPQTQIFDRFEGPGGRCLRVNLEPRITNACGHTRRSRHPALSSRHSHSVRRLQISGPRPPFVLLRIVAQ